MIQRVEEEISVLRVKAEKKFRKKLAKQESTKQLRAANASDNARTPGKNTAGGEVSANTPDTAREAKAAAAAAAAEKLRQQKEEEARLKALEDERRRLQELEAERQRALREGEEQLDVLRRKVRQLRKKLREISELQQRAQSAQRGEAPPLSSEQVEKLKKMSAVEAEVEALSLEQGRLEERLATLSNSEITVGSLVA